MCFKEFIANAVHEVANDLAIVLGVLDQKDVGSCRLLLLLGVNGNRDAEG
jgi:hypothetical protein